MAEKGTVGAHELLDEKALILFRQLEEIVKDNVKAVEELKQANILLGNVKLKNGKESVEAQQQIKKNLKELSDLREQEIDLELKAKQIQKEANEAKKKYDADEKKRLKDLNKDKSKGIKDYIAGMKKTAGAITAVALVFKKLIHGVEKIFNAVKPVIILFDSFNKLMFRVTSSSYDTAESLGYLIQTSKAYGISLKEAVDRYSKFFVAAKQVNLSLEETRKIFTSVAKVSGLLGLKADEVRGVFLALEQMLSKGKVTTEELRRQLGERLPGAFGIMARAAGKSIQEMDDALKAGEIISGEILPKFAEELEKAFNALNLETIDTVVAAEERSKTAYQELIYEIDKGNGVLSNATKLWYAFKTAIFEGVSESVKLTRATEEQKEKLAELEKQQRTLNQIISRGEGGDWAADELEKVNKELERHIELMLKDVDQQALKLKAIDDIKVISAELLRGQGALTTNAQESALAASWEKQLKDEELDTIVEILRTYQKIKNERADIYEVEQDSLAFLKKERDLTVKKISSSATLKNISSKEIQDLIIKRNLQNKEIEELEILLGIKKRGTSEAEKARMKWLEDLGKIEKSLKDLDKYLNDQNKVFDNFASTLSEGDLDKILKKLENEAKKTAESLLDFDISDAERLRLQQLQEELNYRLGLIRQYVKDARKEYEGLSTASLSEMDEGFTESQEEEDEPVEKVGKFAKFLFGESGKADILREQVEEALYITAAFADAIGGIFQALHERKLAQLDAEQEKSDSYYSNQMKLAEGDADLQDKIAIRKAEADEKLDAKRKKLEYEEAKRAKAQALVDIAINTAVAIMKLESQTGILGIPLIPVLIALGAAQAAAVASQPLPEYAEGTDYHKGGPAVLGDGGKREIAVDPTGAFYISGKTPEVVNMPKGTKVLPDANDYIQKQVISSILSLEKNNNELLVDKITDAVIDGFKNTKIQNNNNNNIKVSIDHAMWRNQLLN